MKDEGNINLKKEEDIRLRELRNQDKIWRKQGQHIRRQELMQDEQILEGIGMKFDNIMNLN